MAVWPAGILPAEFYLAVKAMHRLEWRFQVS